MEFNERLKLFQYLRALCHSQGPCKNKTCPYIEDERGWGCLIELIWGELAREGCENENSQKYVSLAQEVSLEEIELTLRDYQQWHCPNRNCHDDCYCCMPEYNNDCRITRVRKKICEKTGKPFIPLDLQTKK